MTQPPEYIDYPDWETIHVDDVEKAQIEHMKMIVDQILHLENVVTDINIEMQYKEIHITIRKNHHATMFDHIKYISKKLAGMMISHPLKCIGLLTMMSIKSI
jgi:hypothetical protein